MQTRIHTIQREISADLRSRLGIALGGLHGEEGCVDTLLRFAMGHGLKHCEQCPTPDVAEAAEATIRLVLPALLRDAANVHPLAQHARALKEAADTCEDEHSLQAARDARYTAAEATREARKLAGLAFAAARKARAAPFCEFCSHCLARRAKEGDVAPTAEAAARRASDASCLARIAARVARNAGRRSARWWRRRKLDLA